MSIEIINQEQTLYSLIIYVSAVIKENISLFTFFSKFIIYLTSNTHQCKCIKCLSEQSTQLQSVKSDIISAVSVSTLYLNSSFEFTQSEIQQLQKTISAENTVTVTQLENLKMYYKRLTETVQVILSMLNQYISSVRADINTNYEHTYSAELKLETKKATLLIEVESPSTITVTPYI